VRPFAERLMPAPANGGYREKAYWVWCGSVVKGEDGRYHMFASRWPKRYPFYHGYLAASEVVRAVSDSPGGPYRFEEVVIPERGEGFWDGRMTHNPFILKYQGTYLLFYIGTTYTGTRPDRADMDRYRSMPGGANGRLFPWFHSIRIGMARSHSVAGPWIRPDQPTLDNNPGGWDNSIVTNPSPCIAPDGRLLLFYRSTGCRLGLAVAASPDAPFEKVGDGPVVDPGNGLRIEDPFAFWNGEQYELVCKDLTGKITGEFHAAAHLCSRDAVAWELAPQPKAWSRTVRWDDGSVTGQGSIERPFILFENSRPSWLFAATADGPGPGDVHPGHFHALNTWNMAVPLDGTVGQA